MGIALVYASQETFKSQSDALWGGGNVFTTMDSYHVCSEKTKK